MSVGQLVVELIASTAAFQSDLGKAAAAAEQHARRIDRALQDVQKSAIGLGKELLGAFGVATSAGALIALFEDIKTKAAESERSVAQLAATLQATGGAAGLTAQDLKELGDAVKGTSIFSDEDIRKAEAALLRFRTIQKGVFEDALKASADLAAAQGIGLQEAAQLVGRFLNAPTTAVRGLRAAGIQLSQSQLDLAQRLIETGRAAEAQGLLIAELARALGGQAQAQTLGLAGAQDRLKRAFDDIKIAIGKQIFDPAIFQQAATNAENLAKRLSTGEDSLLGVLTRILRAAGQITFERFVTGADSSKLSEIAAGALAPPPSAGSRLATGRITGAQSSADQAAADNAAAERAREAAEQAYLDLKEALSKRAATAAQYYSDELVRQKAFLAQQQAETVFAYDRGLITVEDYFAAERGSSDAAYEAIQANLEKQAIAQGKLLQFQGATRQEREAAELRLVEINRKSDEAAEARKLELIKLTQQQIVANERLADTYDEIAAKLAQAQGNAAAAAEIRARVETRSPQFRALQTGAAAGDPFAAAALQHQQQLIDLGIAQARLTDLERDYANVLGIVEITQGRIDLAVQTGNATELDGLRARGIVAQQYAAILSKVADAEEQVALTLSGPEKDKALLGIEQLRLKIAQLGAEADALDKKFRDVFVTSFSNAVTEFVTGAKSLRDAFKDMVNSITRDLAQIASKNVAEQLFAPGGALGGIPKFFSGIFGGGGLFGGAGQGAQLAATAANTTSLAALTAAVIANTAALGISSLGSPGSSVSGGGGFSSGFSGIAELPFLADGTNYVPFDGPAYLHQGEAVVPARFNSRSAANSPIGGGHTFNISVNVPSGTSRASADQIATTVARRMNRAHVRNG